MLIGFAQADFLDRVRVHAVFQAQGSKWGAGSVFFADCADVVSSKDGI
jgi:hypothetical protein